MKYGCIKRAFVWSILFYTLSLFAACYLRDKPEIKNWDLALVFVPLLLIAVSSETMPRKNSGQHAKSVRLYAVVDFSGKCVAFILAQLSYRRIFTEIYHYMGIGLTAVLFLVSLIAEWKMLKILNDRP